ncbi:hypothetical protein [Ideonella sp. BN130291]|uniref:hypothetical protein n=1 Tax=Ideonella sp. BN130291 TaxID=3112940 RepID=UPI002E274D46|nr:hypothetical protein [Ideonella sp. BN130291]
MTPTPTLPGALPPREEAPVPRTAAQDADRAPLQQRFEQGLRQAQQRVEGRAQERPGAALPLSLEDAPQDAAVDREVPATPRTVKAPAGRDARRSDAFTGDEEAADAGELAGWQAQMAASRLQPLPLDGCWGTPAAAPAPQSAITPHDVAATVTGAWLQEPPRSAFAALEPAHWTFTLGDAMTPLASLRVSGDAAAGWNLQLTPARGTSAQALAERGERLRARLQARGQRVHDLTIEDEEPQR